MRQAVIVDAVRTPIGRAHPEKGMYRDVRADDLSADLLKALIDRAGISPELVEDIHWGCVKQQGEQGYDIARMLARVTAPLRTVWGTRDVIARPSLDARLAVLRRHHPELQARLIEGAGHWVMYEAPDAFAAALLDLLGAAA